MKCLYMYIFCTISTQKFEYTKEVRRIRNSHWQTLQWHNERRQKDKLWATQQNKTKHPENERLSNTTPTPTHSKENQNTHTHTHEATYKKKQKQKQQRDGVGFVTSDAS